MTTHRFYVQNIDSQSGQAWLSADQSRQVSRVLRLRSGDPVTIFDGRGTEYSGVLKLSDDRLWAIEIEDHQRPEREPAIDLTVGLSLIRNERFDLAVQKLTEIGVARIAPLLAERSVISYRDERSWRKRRSRLKRIIVEAAEQSERATLPALDDPQSVAAFLESRDPGQTLALVERREAHHISEITPRTPELAILAGPEGGWAEAEINAIDQRATPVGLGDLILRAETAAICSASYFIFRDHSGRRTPT